jgi:hypothetical protein
MTTTEDAIHRMHQYIVDNLTGGVILGVYGGCTESEALNAYARDAGYAHFDDLAAHVPDKIVVTQIQPMPAGFWLWRAKASDTEVAAMIPGLSEPPDPVNGRWAVVVDTETGTPALAIAAEQDADPDMVLLAGLPTDATAETWLPIMERATGLPPIASVRGG